MGCSMMAQLDPGDVWRFWTRRDVYIHQSDGVILATAREVVTQLLYDHSLWPVCWDWTWKKIYDVNVMLLILDERAFRRVSQFLSHDVITRHQDHWL